MKFSARVLKSFLFVASGIAGLNALLIGRQALGFLLPFTFKGLLMATLSVTGVVLAAGYLFLALQVPERVRRSLKTVDWIMAWAAGVQCLVCGLNLWEGRAADGLLYLLVGLAVLALLRAAIRSHRWDPQA